MRTMILCGVLGLFISGPVVAQQFTDSFPMEKCTFSPTGKNPLFVLLPGFQQTFEGKEGSEDVRLTITVLDEIKDVDGIQTRVIKEREVHDGEVVEISRNYFAICKRDNSVFYFGEDTDLYENGVVVSHEGSWLHGKNGAHAGLVMPGLALLGSRFYQEVAPDVALDRAEIVVVDATVPTPAGTFQHCIKTKETTPLEPGAIEFKYYAPGIGLVQDDTLKLVAVSTVAGVE